MEGLGVTLVMRKFSSEEPTLEVGERLSSWLHFTGLVRPKDHGRFAICTQSSVVEAVVVSSPKVSKRKERLEFLSLSREVLEPSLPPNLEVSDNGVPGFPSVAVIQNWIDVNGVQVETVVRKKPFPKRLR